MNILQEDFENAIEQALVNEGGYVKNSGKGFDKKLGLDKVMLFNFIRKSQTELWEKYQSIYGEQSEKYFVENLVKIIAQRGVIDVLRKGFYDRGIKFRLCFFKPETSINENISGLYETNVFACVRQLNYSIKTKNTLDMVLFLNGIPLVTLELKNQYAVHDAQNIKLKYIKERNPNEPIFEFKNRTIIHFAVDLLDVQMTTELAGKNTRFLPFNQGSNGAGNVGGKGNPDNANFPTSYLWERVLKKDMFMEILYKYVYLEKDKTSGNERIIFPRYHQLDVVIKLLDSVRQVGSGKNYLIQHSAGSGKSNSIAWLAHRLSGLHDQNDEIIFHSIIVVTDRKVLDAQLQEAIYQLDHVAGVVEKIDDKKKSVGLKEAINSGKKIIITTLQKFSVIFLDVTGNKKRFAVIVDESHSSQTGEASKKLKRALVDAEVMLDDYARQAQNPAIEGMHDENKLINELISHGHHSNLSFFAFTATPKDKTLKLFGEKQRNGKYKACHTYSMRQAIEEGFILDVLKNYTTYNTYHKIIKNASNNPDIPIFKHIKTNSSYENLYTHDIKKKTAIIVEHFLSITKNKINGRAKVMLVTSSRLNSVKYFLEFKKYLKKKNINDINILVAFSGAVIDSTNQIETIYKEEGLNKTKTGEIIKENQLKKEFRENFHILIVAEKYQTGFDEPLLHTMFIDKKMSGVQAVQTLSRLNRICEGKTDTFILDFRNTTEKMQGYFKPFYEVNISKNTICLENVYTFQEELNDYKIYTCAEVSEFIKAFYKKSNESKNRIENSLAFLRPSLNRFAEKTENEKIQFRNKLALFIDSYSFVAQVCGVLNKDMHKLYIFTRFLQKMLVKDEAEKVLLDNELLLECNKLDKNSESPVGFQESNSTFFDISTNPEGYLSELANRINEKFGTNFMAIEKAFEQLDADIVNDEEVVYFARHNDKATFGHIFEKKFNLMATRMYLENDKFFKKLFEDEKFYKFILSDYLEYIYTKVRIKK